MKRMVIYDGGTFEITARELLFSVIIVLAMLTLGFFVSEKISSWIDEKNQEYEQAAKIDGNKELFEYGMRTDIGNAFVSGTLKAMDSVSLPDIAGEYSFIRKVKEKYTQHERIVTHHSGKMTYTTVENYYTWDIVECEDYACNKITFLDNEFDYGTIPFPECEYLTTIEESSKVRYLYYVCNTEYRGTIYAKLANETISDAKFIEAKGVNEAFEYMCSSSIINTIVFWIIWVILIGGAVYGFCYLNNRWLED